MVVFSHRRDNPRDNEGALNKSINLGCRISRRSIVATLGNFDRYKRTNYCDVWFRFSRKMVQGFWRWWAAADTTRLVVWSGRPKRYREQVDFNLTLDSLRGLPIFACMIVPGGFVILGASLYLLPTWFVLPRTFWNNSDIRQFLKRQYSDREAFRKNIENYITEFRRLNPDNPEGYQTLPLDKLPYDVLHALAQGHGFYLSTKFPIEAVLKQRLMTFLRNLNKQDRMLKSESIVGYLTHRELAWACYRRGFFPTNVLKISSRGILLKTTMGLLAERRSKSRWGDDPRGKKWSDDKNKKSVKMMEKMGWTFGNGIGANEDGRKEHVKIRVKQDNRGVGCSLKYDRQWVAHQDTFGDILADLNATTDAPAERVLADTVQVSSLAKTGSKSGHRYGKFTKAKDLTGASAKHLEEIFGRSSASVAKDKAKKDAEEAEERAKAEANKSAVCETGKFQESTKHVVSKETVADYFKRKMAEKLARQALPVIKNEPVEDASPLDDTPAIKVEIKDEVCIKNEPISDSEEVEIPKKKKKKRKKNKEEEIEVTEEGASEEVEVKQEIVSEEEIPPEPVKKKKKKKKHRQEKEEEAALVETEDTEEQTSKKVKKSKKKKAHCEPEEAEVPAKRRKQEDEEVAEEMESLSVAKRAKKKKKKS
ncbi:Oidioi.mRNA.OKI2018_I69.XSR.g14914.t1.cds [Oikopleura dioica]|uniref:Oidioi.mRNA.OKI2018_I69.XSR.g14914.t1.cds n=1 Tax=Oikopleura dioica TaxID=34765 RepID=A0ABN7SF83_OIKDI|nr:Oidioi.mRNA.OKI2018_I69.XSR.g14914.t1.cds [Oikopleura dioica]